MNPLFDSYKQSQNYSIFDRNSLNAALQNLARRIAPMGLTPEQIVRQKIQNGEMSSEQFNQFAKIADQLTGRNR